MNEERAKDYERRKLLSILVIFRGAPHEQNVAHLSVACNRPHARPIKRSVIDGNEPFIPSPMEFIMNRLPQIRAALSLFDKLIPASVMPARSLPDRF